MSSNTADKSIQASQPLSEEKLTNVSGGIRSHPTEWKIRWHCLDCDTRGDWYPVPTGFAEMEAAKAAHMAETGHTRITCESGRDE